MQKIRFSHYEYEMRTVQDLEEGWIGVELYRTDRGSPQLSARVIYWDATGGFSVETMNGLLPLQVLEQVIAEARAVESPPPP